MYSYSVILSFLHRKPTWLQKVMFSDGGEKACSQQFKVANETS